MRGSDLHEDYVLEAIIGQGGMGEVYRARGPDGGVVALKRMNVKFATRPSLVARFTNEVDALLSCRGMFVLEVVDHGNFQGIPAFASELCSGSLLDVRNGAIPTPARVVQLLCELLVALERVHEAGFVHRDVKPSNVLIGQDGKVRLADFGIVKHPRRRVTEQGTRIGTPSYVALDMIRDPRNAVPSHDLYSVGLLAYSMVTGRNPAAISEDDEAAHSLPSWIERVIRRATNEDSALRYASAAQMVLDLQASLADVPTPEQVTDVPARA